MIKGNTICELQVKTDTGRNEIGETVTEWRTVLRLNGWLDLSGGDSKYTTYSAKIQESTHLFICDYQNLDGISVEGAQAVDQNGKVYDVMLIDDPMQLHQQLEIYLKYTGGQ